MDTISEGVCSLTSKLGPVKRILVKEANGMVKVTRIAKEIADLEDLEEEISIERYLELLEEYNLENWGDDG